MTELKVVLEEIKYFLQKNNEEAHPGGDQDLQHGGGSANMSDRGYAVNVVKSPETEAADLE